MPPLGSHFEARPLTPEQSILQAELRSKGNEVRGLMNLLLPYKGFMGPAKTRYVEYNEPGTDEASNRKIRVRLKRDKLQRADGDGSIWLELTRVPSKDERNQGWDPHTVATVNPSGELTDPKYNRLFPHQQLDYINDVLETVKLMAAELRPELLQQGLGGTALNGLNG
jgi:hypothetical protein